MDSGIILAASGVAVDRLGRVLLVQRGHEPAKGLWSLPGGSLEPGENLPDTVRREMAEETGLEVEVGEKVWQVTVPLATGRFYEVHAFAVAVVGGVLTPGDDAADAKWCGLADAGSLDLTPRLLDFLESYLPSVSPEPTGS